ncbi:MAG TPA: carboxypeptidase-like regulatory domain-containing protein, partial [Patescibacteria group bacterium]|nr:carboxypeptidase-like regulatory domain-containing protein [Patescibacteria group bacterium]
MADNQSKKGFSLLEVIFTVAILAMAIFSLYSLFNISLKMVWETKARTGATQLANKKLEMARNLPYTSVGTVGGVVAGPIAENETVMLNDISYNVYTNVVYVDDPFDGTYNSNPVDPLTNDYKRILVRVSWDSSFSSSPVDFYTDIAPKKGEADLGGGTLAITVFDAGGLPVEAADVHIVNNAVSPAINTHTFTNAQGQLILPGSAAAEDSYQISVTKDDYSSDQTYAVTSELPTPDKPYLTVWEGRTTSDSYAIDRLATLNIHVQDINGLALEGVTVHVRGAKTIGHDGAGNLVYKYEADLFTNAGGDIYLTDIEWDTYTITVLAASGYDIAETDPIQPVLLLPEATQALLVTLRPTAEHSLLTIVRDVDASPVAG